MVKPFKAVSIYGNVCSNMLVKFNFVEISFYSNPFLPHVPSFYSLKSSKNQNDDSRGYKMEALGRNGSNYFKIILHFLTT